MAQNSNHFASNSISPNFEPSRFFRAKKSEPLWQKDTWSIFRIENKGKMNGSIFEPSRFQMHMLSRVIDVLRWLFEPSHHTPRNIFWAQATSRSPYSANWSPWPVLSESSRKKYGKVWNRSKNQFESPSLPPKSEIFWKIFLNSVRINRFGRRC